MCACIYAGIDINARDRYENTALHYACEFDNYYMASLLIKKGINTNLYTTTFVGETALLVAIRKGNTKIANLLIENNTK